MAQLTQILRGPKIRSIRLGLETLALSSCRKEFLEASGTSNDVAISIVTTKHTLRHHQHARHAKIRRWHHQRSRHAKIRRWLHQRADSSD
ncbi:hypothetical protein GOBAR_AA09405 [Gossypium barbadense]|uniref:Uncharacterized protein n=1 Tax=Gossypium barbadense TaxID=3634 RepID=A0A2P5Y6L8_GOSBA|nr:hypothetical protein GOBAR_AA09405 [Gossypium barbadense]